MNHYQLECGHWVTTAQWLTIGMLTSCNPCNRLHATIIGCVVWTNVRPAA